MTHTLRLPKQTPSPEAMPSQMPPPEISQNQETEPETPKRPARDKRPEISHPLFRRIGGEK